MLKKSLKSVLVGVGALLVSGSANAAITIPALPVTDIEATATAVAAVVAVVALSGAVIKLIRKAG